MPPRLDSVVFIHVYKIVYLCIAAGLSLSFKQRTNLILKSSTTANKMKKSKPLTGAQKRKQKRDQKEREENDQKELVADVERLKLGPNPLWKFIVDHRDIFEACSAFWEIKRIRYKNVL